MNTDIQDDFKDFIADEDLFNSDVKLYVSKGGSLVYEGKGIYDKKPNPVENEDGSLTYSGHISILTLSMSDLTFMDNFFSLKGYYVEITDNVGTRFYWINNSVFNSNVNNIYCDYLKEDGI